MFQRSEDRQEINSKAGMLAPVFYPAAGLIALLVIVTLLAGDQAAAYFQSMQAWVSETAGWFYMLSVSGFLVFCLYLAFSKSGEIKLGPNHAEPEYSFVSWFAMLFSAGIGIGLLFFGVAEPVMHYLAPPDGDPRTLAAARDAMEITFFHWGISAWAIYAVVGLVLAYFSFRHNLPLTIRSALYPLIGDRIYGPLGHLVDTLAVVGTLFGVATSLGFGVAQVNAGLNHLLDIPVGTNVQVGLIAVITLFATLSVVSGLNAGIKKLSELNMILAGLLLLFVILAGPTLLFLNSFVENLGLYAGAIVSRSFNLGTYSGNQDWLSSWTLFYWGWWISWSPFVGIFIARISRGRTIREFVLGVLFVPSAFTFIWMTAFGNGALAIEIADPAATIADTVQNNMPVGLFVFLEQLPASTLVSGIAVLLITTFFVTSSDSGSLVIDTITSGGQLHPPVWQRVFWAVLEGLVAAVLMVGGGLAALQSATITTALPFTVVILLACIGLLRGLRMETEKRRGAAAAPDVSIIGQSATWRQRLKALLSFPDKQKMQAFVADTVRPALEQVAAEIQKTDCEARVEIGEDGTELRILHGEEMDFLYAIHTKRLRAPDFGHLATEDELTDAEDEPPQETYYRAEVYLLEGSQHYDVYGFTQDQLIHDILSQYDKHIHFLNIVRS